MHFAGVDLAWQSETNPSALAFGALRAGTLAVTALAPALYGIDTVLARLRAEPGLRGIAIDAPLIIENATGQRDCDRAVSVVYGGRGASCHACNQRLYPDARSVYLSQQLLRDGFAHLDGERWQFECYPHASMIEVFGLARRLKYKKGSAEEKRAGQRQLAGYLQALAHSPVLPLLFDADCTYILNGDHIDSLRGRALKTNEDALDAVVCLYVAALRGCNSPGRVFGDANSGYVWIPHGACL